MKREEVEMRELLLMENKHRWLPQLLRTPIGCQRYGLIQLGH